jgi:hypothetical protein
MPSTEVNNVTNTRTPMATSNLGQSSFVSGFPFFSARTMCKQKETAPHKERDLQVCEKNRGARLETFVVVHTIRADASVLGTCQVRKRTLACSHPLSSHDHTSQPTAVMLSDKRCTDARIASRTSLNTCAA